MSKDKNEKFIPPVDEENIDTVDGENVNIVEEENIDKEEVIYSGESSGIDADELMAEYDRESAYRRLIGFPGKLVFVIAVAWSVFQLYTGLFGTFPSTLQRAPHLASALTLVYLLYPAKRGKSVEFTEHIPWYDYILAAASVTVGSYHIIFYDQLLLRAGSFTQVDVIISVMAIFLLLEAARRVAGMVIVTVASVFLVYAFLGQHLPRTSFLFHAPFTFKRVVCTEWLGSEGILGTPIYVSSTFIFLFLVFATFLKKSGVGDWMTNLATAAVGGQVGGPAKTAVIASALQGTVSGSSVGNVVATGSITIPLMKDTGYEPNFAGAVEAAASTGGQIMPPIMGAAAFIMTEYVGVSYGTVAISAAIPAILYFTGIFLNVHYEALKKGLLGLPKEKRPDGKKLLKEGWFMILPVILIFGLLIGGSSAMKAAMYGIIGCIIVWVINILREEKRFDIIKFVKMFIEALDESARSAITVAITCGTAGIIVGVVTMTGLGLKMADGLIELAGGSLLLTMVFTMFSSLILGMGVPTTANYIIQATISAPALVALGVPPIAAHIFVFYFGIVADITPPVALAAFAGAGISGGNPMKTGFIATRLGIAAYVVPYMLVYNPILVLVNTEGYSTSIFVLMVLKSAVTAIIGMGGLATGFTGYFKTNNKIWESIILIVAGLLLVDPGTATDIAGAGLMIAVYLMQKMRIKKAVAM
ncbi:MAG TPA: C4-dicarboxylate ABC transporter [Clostridiales bacterium]|jgi:TRAP transporter 4TM/12TM fusion protein|nr:C4-dicarboxylate ABC transporter [Clostridiales bacterium]